MGGGDGDHHGDIGYLQPADAVRNRNDGIRPALTHLQPDPLQLRNSHSQVSLIFQV
ncbi:hypothetical protein D3C87_2145670 [compost metagenome]